MTLTKRQAEILGFIEQCISKTGVVPSSREIQEHFGFASQTAAMNHLRALERKGVIQRRAGKARAVSLVKTMKRERIVDIPIYGQIAAGMPDAALEEQQLGVVSLDAATAGISKRSRVFALKVRGDSMTGAHINDGDVVILEMRQPANGEVVAALIDGETTLKRYVLSRGKPFLKAENPRYPDLIPSRELLIQGVLVTLVRRY